jgi:hypothetical protein
MNTPVWSLVAFIFLGLNVTLAVAPPVRAPVQGAVTKGVAVTCVPDLGVECWFQTIAEPTQVPKHRSVGGSANHLRWSLHNGRIYLCHQEDYFGKRPAWESLCVNKFSDVMRLGLVSDERLGLPVKLNHDIPCEPVERKWLVAPWLKFRPWATTDYAPINSNEARLYLLANFGGSFMKEGATNELALLSLNITPEQESKPEWSFVCYRRIPRIHPRTKKPTKQFHWVKEYTIDCLFHEPFRVIAVGNDAYFLTNSGQLYRAAKPEKGTHRKLELIYNEPHQPIAAVITDADKAQTFLFCPSSEGKPAVFQLAEKPRLRSYDEKLYRPGTEGPPELRKVIGYARVLQSLGWITVPEPKGKK